LYFQNVTHSQTHTLNSYVMQASTLYYSTSWEEQENDNMYPQHTQRTLVTHKTTRTTNTSVVKTLHRSYLNAF